jgi:hypothetical protein
MRLLVAITCSAALLAACGSSNDNTAASTTPPTASTSTAAPQSTTTVAPAPTTAAPITIATVAPTVAETTPPQTSPAQTASPATEATQPEPETTETEPATTAETSADSTDAPTTTSTAGQYLEVDPPAVPSVSAPVLADNTQPDGLYYATVTEGGDPPPPTGEVVFELVQLFRGSECTAHFGADDEDSCVNDYGVETDPTSTVSVPLGDQYITVSDASTQKSLRITGAELYSLIHGDDPSAGAPDDYSYIGFGYFLTISGGRVTRLEQWWTP